ncbi:MAG TPA: hypothetical protein VE967_10040 [Gemmatimonadaceae bacterium]|nr:hypothetical protein [Gemmatimonadaceae bacterium]
MRVPVAVSLAALIAVCKEPVAPLNTEFSVRPGGRVRIRETGAYVVFTRVAEDSRCPAGVQCMRAGNAVVELLLIAHGDTARIELGTARGSQETISGDYIVRLGGLGPLPSTSPIEQSAYIASVTVQRRD